jgi:hypothetical protein
MNNKFAFKSNSTLAPLVHVFVSLISVGMLLLLISCGLDKSESATPSIKTEQVYQDNSLIAEAWLLPVASTYKNNFVYQENSAFCGPASIVNTFSSIGDIDISQTKVLKNSSIFYIMVRLFGLTLDQMQSVFEENLEKMQNADWSVKVYRDLSIDEFRQHMRQSNHTEYRYVINFNRLQLFGVDVGHHSPVGGYVEKSDTVFVLDVLEDYKPFVVPVEKLFYAMNTIDSETGKKRGLVQLLKHPNNRL